MERLEITVEFNNIVTNETIVSSTLRNLMKATLTESVFVETIVNKPRDVYKYTFNINKKKIDRRNISLQLNDMLQNSNCVVEVCK